MSAPKATSARRRRERPRHHQNTTLVFAPRRRSPRPERCCASRWHGLLRQATRPAECFRRTTPRSSWEAVDRRPGGPTIAFLTGPGLGLTFSRGFSVYPVLEIFRSPATTAAPSAAGCRSEIEGWARPEVGSHNFLFPTRRACEVEISASGFRVQQTVRRLRRPAGTAGVDPKLTPTDASRKIEL